MTITIPFSEACERNKDVILDILLPYLMQLDAVLEIGSGTAQHAVHFARSMPQLIWQTSDQASYIKGIESQLGLAGLENVKPPIEIDVNQATWVASGQRFSGVYSANTFHIMAEQDVRRFFKGLPDVVQRDSYLFIYGPFKYDGEFTSDSNAAFDESLRSRGVGSGIRDFEMIESLAKVAGFSLLEDHSMPANNQLLIWQAT